MAFKTYLRLITDVLYQELFDADALTLRQRLGLPTPEHDTENDDRLRDALSTAALRCVAGAEHDFTLWLQSRPQGLVGNHMAAMREIGKRWRGSLDATLNEKEK